VADEAVAQDSALGGEEGEDFEYVTDDEAETTKVVAESSNTAANRQRKTRKKVPRRRCISCQDMVVLPYLFRTVCDHDYCGTCLLRLFNYSLVDESLFPPRCCRNLINPEDDDVAYFLEPEVVAKYWQKKVEVETIDRTYCSDPRCSIFLRPQDIVGGRATCATCKKETCTMCKAPVHDGDCPADEATQEILAMARENGWQRCRFCSHMVGISTGCNHMR